MTEKTYYKWFTFPAVWPEPDDLVVVRRKASGQYKVLHLDNGLGAIGTLRHGDLWMRIKPVSDQYRLAVEDTPSKDNQAVA